MGIGEDQELGDAISVTIVATGFAADQQSNITNTEVKKIVHTLEDEQKATYNFTDDLASKTPLIEEPIASVDEKVVYVLEEDVEEDVEEEVVMDLIPTSELIKNMDVVYDSIEIEDISEEDFVITNMTPEIEEEVAEEPKTLQADLLFDLPLNSYEEIKPDGEETRFELTENTLDFDVTDAIEIKAVQEETIEKRYVLDDFDIQPTIGKSSSIVKEDEVSEEELQFELKSTTPQSEINQIETDSEEVSPLSLTITELQRRAEERRQKMKGFNYKFNDQLNKNIDEIERQPAYKRLGVDLDDANTAISKSKTTLSTDENEDIQLKSNNSFLHENVD